MDINKLTIKSQEALQQAQQITLSNGQQIVENAHLLKGILEVDENVTPFLFKKLGVNMERFTEALESIISTLKKLDFNPYYFFKSNFSILEIKL